MIEQILIFVDRVENNDLPNNLSFANQQLDRNEIGSTVQSGPIGEISDRAG